MTLATATMTLPERFDLLENTLGTKVYERQAVIRTAVVALIARKHHLQVGIPGIGKTYLVDELIKLIDGLGDHYFRWLMMRTTTPPEIFGPPSLRALRDEDVYRLNTDHKLPQAFVAFLDEFFKSNSAMLNSLLTIMNEGLFFNNGKPTPLELGTIFTGSNELPREPELAALWDRVTFRHHIGPIKDPANELAMYQNRVAQRRGLQAVTDPVIHWDDILAAQVAAAQVDVPGDVLEALVGLTRKLREAGIEPSERRRNDCIPIIQATAARYGKTVADFDDLTHLQHVLWLEVDQAPTVQKLVLDIANPYDKKALELIEQIEEYRKQTDEIIAKTDNKQQRRRLGIELNGKLGRLDEDIAKLAETVAKSNRRCDLINQAQTEATELTARLLHELWD